MQFLAPIIVLTGLGFFFAVVLIFASKKFAVWQDPKIAAVLEKLPGANCGACGVPGCARFAEGLVQKNVTLDKCKACTEDTAQEIAGILGVTATKAERQLISLHCYGGKNAKDKFEYQGLEDCQAAANTLGGQKLCGYACLGFGDCAEVCPFGAIQMKEGLPDVNLELCTGCGKCVAACPRKLMLLRPAKNKVYVGCSSHDPIKKVAAACKVECIACKKCEKVCPVEAIKVIDNLAVIDYAKCTSCGECVKACPRKIILQA